MADEPSPPVAHWRRQAAIFAAAASAFTGIGVLVVLYFSAKDVRSTPKSPAAPSSEVHANDR